MSLRGLPTSRGWYWRTVNGWVGPYRMRGECLRHAAELGVELSSLRVLYRGGDPLPEPRLATHFRSARREVER